MDHRYYDEHCEDDLPIVSLPTATLTPMSAYHNNETYNFQPYKARNNNANSSLHNWRALYERSLQSLQSDGEDERPIQQTSFHIDPAPPARTFTTERVYSPIRQQPLDSNTSKSKWEINLPQLLNSTVGPDRQKRDLTRRHTTDIVFQQVNEPVEEYYSYYLPRKSNEVNIDRPMAPLVKQLKHKFDQMAVNQIQTRNNRFHSQISPADIEKLQRISSMNSQNFTDHESERRITKPRSWLPIRPIPEVTNLRKRTPSNESVNSRSVTNLNRVYRDKRGPPVSYPKHCYPPPSTTSVIKQVIEAGGTVVYDSGSEANRSKPVLSKSSSQIKNEQTPPFDDDETYASINNDTNVRQESVRKEDNTNFHEHTSQQSSKGPSHDERALPAKSYPKPPANIHPKPPANTHPKLPPKIYSKSTQNSIENSDNFDDTYYPALG